MSETFYKIKRSEGKPKTNWIGSTGCKRKFNESEDTFIVNERELGICIHNGNFELVGPAPSSEVPSQPRTPKLVEPSKSESESDKDL